jgi:hypothetical protein
LFVVSGKRPPKLIDDDKYNKLKYLEFLGNFFSGSKVFKISFATFQRNVRKDINTIKRMRINNLDTLSGAKISEAWIRKYS